MKKYVVYDDTGKIIRYGVCANIDLKSSATKPGEKVMVVDELKDNFDLDNKVADPQGLSPTIIKKQHRI